jgi:hypothetical protein
MGRSSIVSFAFFAIAAVSMPAHAQMGAGGSGIPLGSLGGHDDTDKGEKTNTKERPVSGVVTDANGKPIVGAVVQLKNTRTQKVLTLMTHENGEYQFSGLSKDADYQLTAISNDRSSDPHTLSMYDPRPKPVVNLQVK